MKNRTEQKWAVYFFFSGQEGVEPLCANRVKSSNVREALKEVCDYDFTVNGGLIGLVLSWEGWAERTFSNIIDSKEGDEEDSAFPIEELLSKMYHLGRKPGYWRRDISRRAFKEVFEEWRSRSTSVPEYKDLFFRLLTPLLHEDSPLVEIFVKLCRLAFQAGKKFQKQVDARKKRRYR